MPASPTSGTVGRDGDQRLPLRPVPSSVPQARGFVVGALTAWGRADLSETAALLVSELVTNAVLHARSEIEVRVARAGAGIRVDVQDSSPRPAERRRATDTATTGRGLALVEACATSWGTEPSGAGKAVWFQLA